MVLDDIPPEAFDEVADTWHIEINIGSFFGFLLKGVVMFVALLYKHIIRKLLAALRGLDYRLRVFRRILIFLNRVMFWIFISVTFALFPLEVLFYDINRIDYD